MYHIAKNFSFTREDILKMPIFERRFYITKLSEEFEKKNEAIQQAQNKNKR
tara:strand:+ start:263 stop:415 length:153 start_codon:yes stop_codon:yes gene_type:complete